MAIENDPSARMQLRSRGELVAPACCCVCGNGTCEEGYLDLGGFVDFHGTLYLCMACITQGAETCGMFTYEEVTHLHKQVESLLEDNKTLASELIKANEYISNFDNLLRTAFSTGAVPDSYTPTDVEEATYTADVREPEVKESVTLDNPSVSDGPKLRDITFN